MASKPTMESKQKHLDEVREHCQEMWAELQQALPPGTAINTIEMRLNTLISHLVELGVLSEESKMDFEVKFGEAVEDYMLGMMKDRDTQFAAQRKEQEASKLQIIERPKPPILGPNGMPIGG